MNPFQLIKINGKSYSENNLHELFSDIGTDDRDWLSAIHDFLKAWFSQNDYIEANTSGSTGKPKSILLKKSAMVHSARITCTFFQLGSESNALLCLPAHYIAGKMMLVRAMVAGFNLMVTKPISTPFDNIKAAIDFTAVTPMQLANSFQTTAMSKVGKIIVGGGQLSAKLEEQCAMLFPEIYETYGMTETCSHIALRKVNGKDKSGIFTLLPGISIRFDSRGCLAISAPYVSDEEIITNDLVEIVNENQFKWLGRFDNVINTGGVKVFPESVEKKINHLFEERYFVASLPDEKTGERVILVLENEDPNLDKLQDLKKNLASVLSKFEMPKEIYCLREFIETESGKVRRKQILDSL